MNMNMLIQKSKYDICPKRGLTGFVYTKRKSRFLETYLPSLHLSKTDYDIVNVFLLNTQSIRYALFFARNKWLSLPPFVFFGGLNSVSSFEKEKDDSDCFILSTSNTFETTHSSDMMQIGGGKYLLLLGQCPYSPPPKSRDFLPLHQRSPSRDQFNRNLLLVYSTSTLATEVSSGPSS